MLEAGSQHRYNQGMRFGKMIVILIGIVFAFRSGATVWRLVNAGGKVLTLEKKVQEAEKENAELNKRLEFVKTDAYIEQEAREKLGMGLEGEVVLVIPTDEAAKKKFQISDNQAEANWRKWVRLYLRI